jgi:hypothetical protein
MPHDRREGEMWDQLLFSFCFVPTVSSVPIDQNAHSVYVGSNSSGIYILCEPYLTM